MSGEQSGKNSLGLFADRENVLHASGLFDVRWFVLVKRIAAAFDVLKTCLKSETGFLNAALSEKDWLSLGRARCCLPLYHSSIIWSYPRNSGSLQKA